MDSITKALQRAKESIVATDISGVTAIPGAFRTADKQSGSRGRRPPPSGEIVEMSEALLRQNHAIAFDADAGPTRFYDILRNQVLQHERKAASQIVAVVAPTRRCGTTVTAMNLAFSFARIRAQRVILLDANDDNPSIRRYLGLPGQGWLKHSRPSDTEFLTDVQIRDVHAGVLTLSPPEHDGAETITRISRIMRESESTVVIVDLPPMLSNDKAISYLGIADSIVVVLSAGQTTHNEVESCKTFLAQKSGVQFVLNKAGRNGL